MLLGHDFRDRRGEDAQEEYVPCRGDILKLTTVMTWGTSWDVVFACLWTVSVPYMLTTLGSRVGYIVSHAQTMRRLD